MSHDSRIGKQIQDLKIFRIPFLKMSSQKFRSIRTFENKFVYLDIELCFTIKQATVIEVREFKLIIMNAIDSLLGEIGSKIQFDILKYRNNDCRALIRLLARDYVKFHLCLSLLNEWKDSRCQFIIHKTSHCLASIVVSDSIEDNLVTVLDECESISSS
ncbi:ribonuclease P protein subunit p14 [Dermatophagoides farinae]|uniref:Nucleic acid binding, variant 2 n=2 Tax=Dermatophagoides farinae TaxID=6954 RepID=A0A922LB37_DERFA|nr:uncharacterized protein LOC124491602 [Dermatophagoides farinae]KAH9530111.1 nucleic acid binding, variant 2 [Dermatophagoides farinae]